MISKSTVVFLFLGFYSVSTQPILNKKSDKESSPQVAEKKPSPGSLVQLVVDNDEARKKWYEQREKSLHDSTNGANGHYIKGKDENEADASAIPSEEDAPVATPMQLIALLKKRRGSKSEEHVRVIRQVVNPPYQVAPTIGGYPSPYVYQPQPYPYTSPAPPPPSPVYTSPVPTTTLAPPPPPTTPKPPAPKVEETVQSARDEYRKNRFAGSAYALALKLSKAGNTPLSEGGSYSG